MTPMVFCASFVPCASETREALPIWPMRKVRSRPRPARLPMMRNTSQVPTAATAPARIGDMSAGRITLPTTPSSLDPSPAQFTPFSPRPASVEPMRPPNSACEELDGRPSSQVSRFQTMPPMRPAKHDEQQRGSAALEQRRVGGARLVLDLHDRVRDGERDLDAEERAHQVEHRGERDRDLGLQRAGRDGRGHRVRRVVEAVGEVEGERRDDDEHEENEWIHGDDPAPCSRVPSTGDRRVHRLFTRACGEAGPGRRRSNRPGGPACPTPRPHPRPSR